MKNSMKLNDLVGLEDGRVGPDDGFVGHILRLVVVCCCETKRKEEVTKC